jgi:hypothetical protein
LLDFSSPRVRGRSVIIVACLSGESISAQQITYSTGYARQPER